MMTSSSESLRSPSWGLGMCFLAAVVMGPAAIGWLVGLAFLNDFLPRWKVIAVLVFLEALLVHVIGQVQCLKLPTGVRDRQRSLGSLALNSLAAGVGVGLYLDYMCLWTSPLTRLTVDANALLDWPISAPWVAAALVVLTLAALGMWVHLGALRRLAEHLQDHQSATTIGMLRWFWIPASGVALFVFVCGVAVLESVRPEDFSLDVVLLAPFWLAVWLVSLPLVLLASCAVWLDYCRVLWRLSRMCFQMAQPPASSPVEETSCRST